MVYAKNLNWMQGSFGLSSHYTSQVCTATGVHLPYEEALLQFDIARLADVLESVGAVHYFFTLTHAEQYLPMPNRTLDAILPGRTAQYDFLASLIEELTRRHIRLVVYYNHSCNGNDDPLWKKTCGYTDGGAENLNRFAENICAIVHETSCRYGDGISGWWFDSAYSVDPRGPYNSISCPMGDWQFPWDALVDAAESGNPNTAVAVNAGIGEKFQYTNRADYYAGEANTMDFIWEKEESDLQDSRWCCIDSSVWVLSQPVNGRYFVPPLYTDEDLRRFITLHLEAGHMVTCNCLTDQTGVINPYVIEQLRRIRHKTGDGSKPLK